MSRYESHEIDFTGVATVEQFHQRIRQGLKVPEYYGDNLDSLSDVLSEMSGRVVFRGTGNTDEDMQEYMSRFRSMCADAKENRLLEVVVL